MVKHPPLSAQQSPRQNHLLAALPAADYERLLPDLEVVPLPLGWAVSESGSQQRYVYFPTNSIVSLLYVMEDGSSAEIAVVGNECLVGIALVMGGETTPSRAVVQSAGEGYRLSASVLKTEFGRGGDLQHLLLRYTQALITQMTQTAVCNRHHALEKQLCPTPPRGHDQGIDHQLRHHLRMHRPAHHLAAEQIDRHRNVQPALGGPQVGKVCRPFPIRPIGCKLPIQHVRSNAVLRPQALIDRAACVASGAPEATHSASAAQCASCHSARPGRTDLATRAGCRRSGRFPGSWIGPIR